MVYGTTLGLALDVSSFQPQSIFSKAENRLMSTLSRYVFVPVGLFLSLAMTPLESAAQQPESPCFLGGDDCGAAPPSPSTGAKKWHPGHYMQLMAGKNDVTQEYRFARYDEIANNTDIEGVAYYFRWSMLEGDTRGDYSAGFAMLHAELDKLESLAVPKRLIIRMNSIAYGKPCPAADHYPAYVKNNGWLFETSSCIIKLWDADAATAYIELLQAYAAEFDDEPFFEAIYLVRETAPGWQGRPVAPDFSKSAYIANMERIVAAAGEAFVKTNAIQSLNFIGNQSDVNKHMAYLYSQNVGHGAPDLMPPTCTPKGSEVQSDIAYIGLPGGDKDWRGILPSLRSIEATEMGGHLGDCFPDQLHDWANNTIKASHVFWMRNTYAGTAAQQWPAILAFLKTHPITNRACPSMYTQGCQTE